MHHTPDTRTCHAKTESLYVQDVSRSNRKRPYRSSQSSWPVTHSRLRSCVSSRTWNSAPRARVGYKKYQSYFSRERSPHVSSIGGKCDGSSRLTLCLFAIAWIAPGCRRCSKFGSRMDRFGGSLVRACTWGCSTARRCTSPSWVLSRGRGLHRCEGTSLCTTWAICGSRPR